MKHHPQLLWELPEPPESSCHPNLLLACLAQGTALPTGSWLCATCEGGCEE